MGRGRGRPSLCVSTKATGSAHDNCTNLFRRRNDKDVCGSVNGISVWVCLLSLASCEWVGEVAFLGSGPSEVGWGGDWARPWPDNRWISRQLLSSLGRGGPHGNQKLPLLLSSWSPGAQTSLLSHGSWLSITGDRWRWVTSGGEASSRANKEAQ